MADASGLPFPYFDQAQTPAWIDAQRQQQMAQMLMGAFQQTNQTPQDWNSMRVVPRRGALQNVSSLASALMGAKAQTASFDANSKYLKKIYSPDPQPTGPGAGIIDPNAPPEAQAAAQDVTAGNTTPQPQPQNPMLPPGMSRQTATMMMNMPGGPEEFAKLVGSRFMPTDMQKNDAYMGMSPQQRKVATLSDALRGAVVPSTTATLGMDPGGNVTASTIPGLQQNQAALTAANEAAKASQTPHYEQDPFHPGRVMTSFPTPPGAAPPVVPQRSPGTASGGASSPAAPNNAAALEGQKSGAQDGVKYAAEIQDNANSALQGKRTLSEMSNLLQGFTPGAGAPVLAAIGGAAQALGVPSSTVEKFTKMNVGDTQAFQKGTAALAAESAKQMTNKVTQQDFKIYLQNNPNWMMTPDGIKRAMDYMNRGFDQPLAKQQAFADFSKTASPDRWRTEFDSQWNKAEAERIKQGQYNSAPASMTGVRTSTDVSKGPAPQYTEGQIAHNPSNGQTLIFRGGRWVPGQ